MAASHGVMTFLVPHSPTIGAIYEDMDAPAAERMIPLYERAVSIYEKYGLDLYVNQSGCVRGGWIELARKLGSTATRRILLLS